jgi:hypothetical protein
MEDSAFAVQCPSECGCENALRAAKQPCRTWYIDYRVQQMFDSNTSFQFGSSAPLTGPYTPIRAYNIDYHLQRGGDMHQMMSTGGGALHLALIADAPFNNHCSVGLQADHTEIRTTGTLRQVQDNKWSVSDYGVQVNSDQTSLTAYFRFCR